VRLPTTLTAAYRRLLVADMTRQLPGDAAANPVVISDKDVAQLLSAASRLALSEDDIDRTLAYEIATRLVEVKQEEMPGVITAAEVILARLGNFPGRRLLCSRSLDSSSLATPLYLSLESMSREDENSVAGPDGKQLPLTDFQYDLLSSVKRSKSVSVSAPTSAGKSFVMSLDIIQRLRRGTDRLVIYVVPTRALIRQVMLRIVDDLNKAGLPGIPVRCVPIPIERDNACKGAVYVLTQERLMSLLYAHGARQDVSLLIVDESQGIGDGARGIVLQTAIETVLDRSPQAEVVFASPLTLNPEYLLKLFHRTRGGVQLTETHSPVSQNRILVSKVSGKPGQARFSLLVGDETVDLGIRNIPVNRNTGKFLRRAAFARAITRTDESTIVYANGAVDAEKIALALTELGNAEESSSPEVADLIEFLREHIHPEYALIDVLRGRVAYHYGEMPAIVRSRIEDLAEEGQLNFICCTSTLLQGVNLPARHVVIENPSKGKGQSMKAGDFLNLAGRAGRLLKEFHGNIWCIYPEDWDEPSYKSQELQPITSAFAEVMADGGSLVRRLVAEGDVEKEKHDLAEAALGKIYAEFAAAGRSLEASQYCTESNLASLRETEQRCKQISSLLPPEIFRKNATIHPGRLERLREFLMGVEDLTCWLPMRPTQVDSNFRLSDIIKKAGELLGDLPEKILAWYAILAAKWVHEVPFREILEERLAWLRRHGRAAEVNVEIRMLMSAMETGVRYHCVKFARAYHDVLTWVLTERGEPEVAAELPSIYVFLECGASSPVVLSLISLGLSRTTALLLKGKITFPENADPETCLARLGAADLASLDLPRLCLHEIEGLLRPSLNIDG